MNLGSAGAYAVRTWLGFAASQLDKRLYAAHIPGDQLEARRLRAILETARTLPGYKEYNITASALEDPLAFLWTIPRLEKSALRGNEPLFWRQGPALDASTSGTTGTPLRLKRSLYSAVVEEAWLAHWRSSAGHRPTAPTAVLRGALLPEGSGPVPHQYSRTQGLLTVSSYHIHEGTVSDYLTLLRRHGTRWIFAYPSSVTSLATAARGMDLTLPALKGIFTSSETLTPENRRFLEEAWGCKVWDHYGNAERTVAASQCREGRYHMPHGYAIVEPCDEGILTTTLLNRAMPLLRYLVTDQVAGWSQSTCDCLRPGPTFSEVTGRVEDVVYGQDGRMVGRLDHIFKGVEGVVAGQIQQDLPDRVIVRAITAGPTPESRLRAELTRRSTARLGRIEVDVEFVSKLAQSSNGKAPFVIQNMRPRLGSTE